MKLSQLLALTVLSVAFGEAAFAQSYAVAKAKAQAPAKNNPALTMEQRDLRPGSLAQNN